MDIPEHIKTIGGFMLSLYETCSSEAELETQISDELKHLFSHWKLWWDYTMMICPLNFIPILFPLTSKDINYLNSPFIDVMVEIQGMKTDDAMEYMCNRNRTPSDLNVIIWIDNHSVVSTKRYENLFQKACIEGRIDILNWVKTKIECDIHLINHSMGLACINNNLDVLKWMVDTYNLNSNHPVYNSAFYTACVHGYLDIIKYLVNTFILQISTFNDIYLNACRYGQLDIVKYILSIKHLDNNIRQEGLSSIRNKYPLITQFLKDNYRDIV